MAQISLRRVQKRYDDLDALKNIDLEVAHDDFLVILGPSGSGKTTLLRVLAGLETADDGEVRIDGELVNSVEPADRNVAMVFQQPALYPHMTVAENLAFGQQGKEGMKIAEVAALLHLAKKLNAKPGELSGGERQRVAIGRALARRASVYLLDEPLSNLDATLRAELRAEFARLRKHLEGPIVWVTHDQMEAMVLATRIVVLRDGQIQQIGEPMEVFRHPSNLFVAQFVGSPRMNLIRGVVTQVAENQLSIGIEGGDTMTLDVEAGDLQAADPVTVGVRSEQMRLQPDGALGGTVVGVECLGADSYLLVDLDGTLRQQVVLRMPAPNAAMVGATVRFSLPASGCQLFDASGSRTSFP